jgi:hypothetical protein
MFTKKQFTRIAIIAVTLMAEFIWPLSQAKAALAPESAAKANGTSKSQIEMSGVSSNAVTPDKPMRHRSSLDGKEFMGKMTDPTDNTKSYDEMITFRNGKFHSSACDAYGFGMASYTTKKDNGMTLFTAETTSNKDGHISQMNWHGSIKGNELTATAEMVMDGKSQGTSTIKAMMETQTVSKMK